MHLRRVTYFAPTIVFGAYYLLYVLIAVIWELLPATGNLPEIVEAAILLVWSSGWLIGGGMATVLDRVGLTSVGLVPTNAEALGGMTVVLILVVGINLAAVHFLSRLLPRHAR